MYINTYIWNIEKLYWWTYLHGRIGDTDIENSGGRRGWDELRKSRILKWVAMLPPRESSQARDRNQVSCIAGRFFTNWAARETREHWSGSLSLLQGSFPTQESNQNLLDCRRILYQLIYQGSPTYTLSCVRNIAAGKLIYNTGAAAGLSVMT